MKTKLGISVALLGSAVYFLALFGGWLPVIIVAGYILLIESNEWLRKSAIKAVGICLFFSVLSAIIGFVPDAIALMNGIFNIFNESFSIAILSRIIALVIMILSIAQKILLLVLGFKALHQGSVGFGVIDRLVAKHTQNEKE